MMLEWFLPGALPEGGTITHIKNDVTTYRKIHIAARAIEKQCTEIHFPGWALLGERAVVFSFWRQPLTMFLVGEQSAMGVFIWAKDSDIDEMTGGFPVLSPSVSSNASSLVSVVSS